MKAFDSFTWIEYFSGSLKGAKVRAQIERGTAIYTPSVCLTEIKLKYLREGRDPGPALEFVLDRSLIIDIDEQVALRAADSREQFGLHMVDALIYSAARSQGLTLVTGDQHFSNVPDVELI